MLGADVMTPRSSSTDPANPTPIAESLAPSFGFLTKPWTDFINSASNSSLTFGVLNLVFSITSNLSSKRATRVLVPPTSMPIDAAFDPFALSATTHLLRACLFHYGPILYNAARQRPNPSDIAEPAIP